MRAPGTNEQQIKALGEKVGDAGVKTANEITHMHHPDIIALAYKVTRVSTAKNKLPKSVTKLLSNLTEKEAEAVRRTLVGAKK